MEQRRISAMRAGDAVRGYYALREASLQNTTAGKPYVRLTVGDASGAMNGNLWDGADEAYASLVPGGAAWLEGTVESFRGALQLKVWQLRMAAPDEVAPELLLPASRLPLDAMERELDGHLAAVADPDYAALLHEFFDDPEFRRAFVRAPAAKSNHHAWVGGLLEHTVAMARYARAFLDEANVTLDASLLMTGVILHDAGKVHELSLGAAIEYSDRGRLLGHITIGVGMVAERAARLPGFPPEKTWLLQHLILSHHGRQEYGSPVLPAVPEALVLHHLDNLDAKSVAAAGVLESDPTPGHWTARSFMLDTCLYRGDSRPTTGSAPAGAGIAPAPATSAAPHGPSPAPRRPAPASASPRPPRSPRQDAPGKPAAPQARPPWEGPEGPTASSGPAAPGDPGGLFG